MTFDEVQRIRAFFTELTPPESTACCSRSLSDPLPESSPSLSGRGSSATLSTGLKGRFGTTLMGKSTAETIHTRTLQPSPFPDPSSKSSPPSLETLEFSAESCESSSDVKGIVEAEILRGVSAGIVSCKVPPLWAAAFLVARYLPTLLFWLKRLAAADLASAWDSDAVFR